MKVFKLYGVLLKKNIASVISYVIAFMVITILFISSGSSTSIEFNETKVNVSFINNDDDTELINGLKKHLEKYVIYQDVKPEHIDDALYYREIFMAFTVPENFTEDFLSGKDVHIIQQILPDSTTKIAVNRAINKYLNLVTLYHNNLDEDISNIINYVELDLKNEVTATKTVIYNNTFNAPATFYNYLSYLFYALIMSVIGIIMLRFRKTDIKRRMGISPYTPARFNLEIILGHSIFIIVLVILVSALSFLYYPQAMASKQGALFIINAFCVCLPILGLGFVLSLLIKNESSIGAAVNVISLGTSFLAGAFIPQFLLGKGMLAFAHILPNFYYIANNDRIRELTDFSWNGLRDIVFYMVIQILFAIGFLVISIIITNKQRKQES